MTRSFLEIRIRESSVGAVEKTVRERGRLTSKMTHQDLFDVGRPAQFVPDGPKARQAVAALGGYAYQILVTAQAWLEVEENTRVYLEVAEDYAEVAGQAVTAVQIKDSMGSGTVTLNSQSIRDTIVAFVDLTQRNPETAIELRFLTTSEIGRERSLTDRLDGMPGLEYWKKAAAGKVEVAPLRAVLEGDAFPASVRDFSEGRTNEQLRQELVERIHWDCGSPSFPTLRQELEARLIVIGRDKFGLSADNARGLVDTLVFHVLKKSIRDDPSERVLTHAELYRVIDYATHISVPHSSLFKLIDVTTKLASRAAGGFSGRSPKLAEGTDWLIDGAELPAIRGMIGRPSLTEAIADVLDDFGTAIIVGSSGLGKSTIARMVASDMDAGFFIVHFRNMNLEETSARLDMVLSRVSCLDKAVLVLEDLNHIENPQVSASLSRVIEATRRHYGNLTVTIHHSPSLNFLIATGLETKCVVKIPYFSEQETSDLISAYGGDPSTWGRFTYIMGASGHPQLTHAFVRGVAERGWPAEEMQSMLIQGLASKDTDAVRDQARQHVLAHLPETTRSLLYRLSFVTGNFDRSLSLVLAEMAPAISHPGGAMDQLTGPWIEPVAGNLFRVSPLAKGSGAHTLSLSEQKHIHRCIAEHMLSGHTIDAGDIEVALSHALAAEAVGCLATVSRLVLTARPQVLEKFSQHTMLIRFFKTDQPIYRQHPICSVLLRLVQLRLAVMDPQEREISSVTSACLREIEQVPEGEHRQVMEFTALFTVLTTMGIANHLTDWLVLLLRFETIIRSSTQLSRLITTFENKGNLFDGRLIGMLFHIGINKIRTAAQLEVIFDQLDKIDADTRADLLEPVDDVLSDYSSLVNSSWLACHEDEGFDAARTAACYRRMAERTRNWGYRPLTVQCWVAAAIMLDEYQDDTEAALATLKDARATLGDDPLLERALAKVHLHCGNHDQALTIFRNIAAQVGNDNPVERAFALREAAISATNSGDCLQAERWFLDAQSAAKLADGGEMAAMAAGLGADSAVAAAHGGNLGGALSRLSTTLEALSNIDPEANLRAAYCHRVARHAILWMQSRVELRDIEIGGQPIRIEAGHCSNPDPLPAIKQLPLGHIDIAWYILAETEQAAGLELGILQALDDRLEPERIPALEFSLRLRIVQARISRFDPKGFAGHLWAYIEATVYLLKDGKKYRKIGDFTAPERHEIPALDSDAELGSEADEAANASVIAYCLYSVLSNRSSEAGHLEAALNEQFANSLPGRSVFKQFHGQEKMQGELEKIVCDLALSLSRGKYLPPPNFWMAGLRLFEWVNRSHFKELLVPVLASWYRSGWQRIIAKEGFYLTNPGRTVPLIREVLANDIDDERLLAKLILVASESVGAMLDRDYREMLNSIASSAR